MQIIKGGAKRDAMGPNGLPLYILVASAITSLGQKKRG